MLYQKSATSHRVSSHGPTLTRLGDALYARGVWRGSDPSSVTALLPVRFTSFSAETKTHFCSFFTEILFYAESHTGNSLRSKSLMWSSSLLQLNNASVSVIRSSLNLKHGTLNPISTTITATNLSSQESQHTDWCHWRPVSSVTTPLWQRHHDTHNAHARSSPLCPSPCPPYLTASCGDVFVRKRRLAARAVTAASKQPSYILFRAATMTNTLKLSARGTQTNYNRACVFVSLEWDQLAEPQTKHASFLVFRHALGDNMDSPSGLLRLNFLFGPQTVNPIGRQLGTLLSKHCDMLSFSRDPL